MPVDEDCRIDPTAEILFPDLVNIYGTTIGAGTRVGPFVEIQRGCVLGKHVNFQHHSYLANDTVIGDYVFFGPGSGTLNDGHPTVYGPVALRPVVIENWASIGGNAIILPGVTVGEGAIVGAGAVVTKDVPPHSIALGNPARVVRQFADRQERNRYVANREASRESSHSHTVPGRSEIPGPIREADRTVEADTQREGSHYRGG